MSDLSSPSPPLSSPPPRPLTPTPLDKLHADDEPPAKKLRTDLHPLLPISPLPASHPSLSAPSSDPPLLVPQPIVAVSVSTLSGRVSPPLPLPSQPRPSRHRPHRHHRRHSPDAGDVDYQPVAGDDADDDMTLLLDDLQRVEGEEEEELLALQRDADIDIEDLRRRLHADAQPDDDEDEEGDEGEGEGEEDSAYDSDEDSVDVNDLPRLKDLQLLRLQAAAQGLSEPASLLDPASLNTPFPPKPRAAQVSPLPPVDEAPHSAPLLASQPPEPQVVPVMAVMPVVDLFVPAQKGEEAEVKAEEAEDAVVGLVRMPAPVDATERELVLSRELGLTVEEMRAADRAYDEERQREAEEEEAQLQQRRDDRRAERHRRPAAQTSDDGDRAADELGYLSSSSSAASGSDESSDSEDSDDGSRSLSPYSAAFYTSSHSFYPSKTSRVGPMYQPDEVPEVISDADERLMECERNRRFEGDRVDMQWEMEPPVESVYWQVEARRVKLMEERVAQETAIAAVIAGSSAMGEDGGQAAEAEVVHQPAVRSQRSSAKRAREYIATVASSEMVARGGEGMEGDGAGAESAQQQTMLAEAVNVSVLT